MAIDGRLRVGCALCESVCDCGNCDGNCGGGCCDNCKCPTPERDELFKAIENAPARFNESYVKNLDTTYKNFRGSNAEGRSDCQHVNPPPKRPRRNARTRESSLRPSLSTGCLTTQDGIGKVDVYGVHAATQWMNVALMRQ